MAQKPRRTRTTQVTVRTDTSFKQLSDQTGIPSATISARYHAFKEANPRTTPHVDDLLTYQRRPRDEKLVNSRHYPKG